MGCCVGNVGKFGKRVVIEDYSTVQNVAGEEVKTWATASTVWAKVEPLSGKERFEAKQVAPEISHKITMRGGITITPENRITFDSRIFNINAILNIEEADVILEVLCTESPDP